MVLRERRVRLGWKEPKDQRVEVVSQVHLGPQDLQDQREKEVPPECRVILENREKREILDPLDQEGETDPRGLGEIPDRQDHKEAEERGVHVVSEGPPALLVPQEQRERLVNLAFQETAETRDLQALRGRGDRQDLVDQWVYQENQVYQDTLDLVERREHKEKPGLQALLECRVVGVQ